MSDETKTEETVEEKTDDTQEEVAEEVDIKEVIAAAIAELKLALLCESNSMQSLRQRFSRCLPPQLPQPLKSNQRKRTFQKLLMICSIL